MTGKELNKKIESIFKEVRFTPGQLRFFRPDRLMKMITKLDGYTGECKSCKDHFKDAEEIILKLGDVNDIPEELAYKYNNVFKNIAEHLKDEHNLVLPRFYSSAYSIAGLFAGILIWLAISYFAGRFENFIFDNKTMFLISGFAGLIIGRLIGAKKDRVIREKDLRIY